MKKFKVGDRVLLSRDSEYYGEPPEYQLPPDVVGKVIEVHDYFSVEWEYEGETYRNSYMEWDLISVFIHPRLKMIKT